MMKQLKLVLWMDYKNVREEINKARSEIISELVVSSYNHGFGTFLLGTHLNFRSSITEKTIQPKKKELELEKKIEASVIDYEFLTVQHAALTCILERKYDNLNNVTIYDQFISPYLLRRYSQYHLCFTSLLVKTTGSEELI